MNVHGFREINLGSNEMAEPTAAILSQVVIQNLTLRSIDLSCNRLGPVGAQMNLFLFRMICLHDIVFLNANPVLTISLHTQSKLTHLL